MNQINSYLNLKMSISNNRDVVIMSILFGTICSACILVTIWTVIFAVLLYALAGHSIYSIITSKRKIKNQYPHFLGHKKSYYEEEVSRLREQKYDVYEELLNLSNKKNSCIHELEKLRHFEQVVAFLDSKEGILLNANSEEEYNFLKQTSEEKEAIFSSYLEEKVDYSNIHFENNIGDNTEYTENSKKLMKKISHI